MANKTKYKYTDEKLTKVIAESKSMAGVMRSLGIRLTGGSQHHLTKRIKKLGACTAHFTGSVWNRGGIGKRKGATELLILREEGRREHGHMLTRALLEIGRPYKCEGCGNEGVWRGKKLVLEVDHKNRNWLDDRADNLRFMCPSCHSQE